MCMIGSLVSEISVSAKNIRPFSILSVSNKH
ncbi:hypothetical protein OIU79_029696 [Salix purpurea]|uniref:Uncharacterized protein n=1 Tax=Salix purpurea TaxID=77065 RepID=A0A9Q0VH99_SALPP|nr:hypothetical protein OIU79_029696 [Salix purpurea]